MLGGPHFLILKKNTKIYTISKSIYIIKIYIQNTNISLLKYKGMKIGHEYHFSPINSLDVFYELEREFYQNNLSQLLIMWQIKDTIKIFKRTKILQQS